MASGEATQPAVREDTSGWTGEGDFTAKVLDAIRAMDAVRFIKVENAPSTRSDADYNFISNEIFVAFREELRPQTVRLFGVLPVTRRRACKIASIPNLERRLVETPEIGVPDYSDDGMIQYLRTERIIPPFQTGGYKIVQQLRIYEVGSAPRR